MRSCGQEHTHPSPTARILDLVASLRQLCATYVIVCITHAMPWLLPCVGGRQLSAVGVWLLAAQIYASSAAAKPPQLAFGAEPAVDEISSYCTHHACGCERTAASSYRVLTGQQNCIYEPTQMQILTRLASLAAFVFRMSFATQLPHSRYMH